MNNKIKISAVSYLNTLPFIYGLDNFEDFSKNVDLHKDIPSVCADKLINNEVDIGLIPVAEIRKLKTPFVISNYCIGAVGKVETVLLLSDVPVQEIRTIYLDYQSRTSVNLLKILIKNHWQVKLNYINATEGFEEKIEGHTAGLIIGDRAFKYANKFQKTFDCLHPLSGTGNHQNQTWKCCTRKACFYLRRTDSRATHRIKPCLDKPMH